MDRAAFDRELEKGFDSGPAGRELSSSRSPVHVLTQEDQHPEYRYLRLERFAAGTGFDAAVAAQNSRVGLFNPANSGALIMVRRLILPSTLAAGYVIRIGTTTVWDSTAAGRLLDIRYGPPASVRATGQIVLLTSAGGVGNQIAGVEVPANSTLVLPLDVVLPPGTNVLVETAANNLICTASWHWIERNAEPGEIQGAGV